MLEAYSIAWLWANDAVLKKLNTHIKLQVEKSQNPRSINQAELKKSYTECILEMRKDSGYKDTNQEESDFQFISF
jgi:ABC-type bacteriocin/lantibiotic exporter with double-glycine peptidase domain